MNCFETINRTPWFARFAIPSRLIGQGSSARVYAIDRYRVLKFTSDQSNAALLSSQCSVTATNPVFPIVSAELGLAAQCADCQYYGYVMERLYPPSGTWAPTLQNLHVNLRRRYDAEALSSDVDAAFLEALARGCEPSMRAAFRQLAGWVKSEGWLVDRFERGNLLERANGQPCLSDLTYSLVPFIRPKRAAARA